MSFPFPNYGILGLNARNLLYIKPFNPRKAVQFADDKMKTKDFLSARGIPAAKVFAKITSRKMLRQFDFSTLPDQCVLKPNYGFGGEGILILNGRQNGIFLEEGRRPVTSEELIERIEDILDGKYSVNGKTDTAFFEQILFPHECFNPFRPAGLPDIRIVVFNLVPVMAMLRIPTAESGGKANVHLGGIGIGIDIAKGVTTYATRYNKLISELPHGGNPRGILIPGFEELLMTASRIQYITNIGYLAVDLTIEKDLGPVLLEVNARAGLMVQIANLSPLRARLERVKGLTVSSPEKGVRLAQELFGQKTHKAGKNDEQATKPKIGIHETIEISGSGIIVEEPVYVSIEHEHTVFSPDILGELVQRGAVESMPGTGQRYKVKFSLAGKKIQTVVRAGDTPAGVKIVIGRRDIAGFLIDPAKPRHVNQKKRGIKIDLRALDKILAGLDRELPLLKELRPLNLREEREKAAQDMNFSPVFLQREFEGNLNEIESRLTGLNADDSPLGLLLKKKQRELFHRIDLIRARGSARHFTSASLALYGAPSTALIGFVKAYLMTRAACDLPPPRDSMLSADEAAGEFESVLKNYGLFDFEINIRTSMVTDCATGDKKIYIRSKALFSRSRIEALIAHEIETHILTAENGRAQPFELFRRGFANYLDTQEGLAIYNQHRVLPPFHERRFAFAKNVLAVAYAMEHSFSEVRKYLLSELGYTPEAALTKSLDLKRGLSVTAESGAFTKSLVYFRGLRAIEQFVSDGGDLRRLYIGKIAIEDLPLVAQIPSILPPILLPEYLRQKS